MSTYDQAASGACTRKRQADSLEELRESVAEIRRCKRRRSAWLRAKEVEWWDDKARQVQDKADQADAFGVFFSTFKELRNRGLSFALGEVRPADVQSERDAWAEHFRLIGEGSGLVAEKVWDNVPTKTRPGQVEVISPFSRVVDIVVRPEPPSPQHQ